MGCGNQNKTGTEDIADSTHTQANSAQPITNGFLQFDTLTAFGTSKRGICSYKYLVPDIKIKDPKPGTPLVKIKEYYRKVIVDKRLTQEQLDSCEKANGNIPNVDEGSFDVYRNDNKVFGVRRQGYWFGGGAHGLPWWTHDNLSIATGEGIPINAILKEGFLPSLNALLKEKLKPYEQKDQLLSPLSEFKGMEKESDINFKLYRTYIVVCFSVYEVTPYAVPPPEIEISFQELKPYVRQSALEAGWIAFE